MPLAIINQRNLNGKRLQRGGRSKAGIFLFKARYNNGTKMYNNLLQELSSAKTVFINSQLKAGEQNYRKSSLAVKKIDYFHKSSHITPTG